MVLDKGINLGETRKMAEHVFPRANTRLKFIVPKKTVVLQTRTRPKREKDGFTKVKAGDASLVRRL